MTTIKLTGLTRPQVLAAEEAGAAVTKSTATFTGDLSEIGRTISDLTVMAKADAKGAGRNAAAPHWDRLAAKFAEAVEAGPVDVDPVPEPEEPTAKRVYAPAIKAQGEKTWKEAAKLYAKLGSVKAVAEHYGCSGTAAARWVRQGEALLSK